MLYRNDITQRLKVVPCYIITSYLARDFFQVLHNIIAPAALMIRQQSYLIITPEREYSNSNVWQASRYRCS